MTLLRQAGDDGARQPLDVTRAQAHAGSDRLIGQPYQTIPTGRNPERSRSSRLLRQQSAHATVPAPDERFATKATTGVAATRAIPLATTRSCRLLWGPWPVGRRWGLSCRALGLRRHDDAPLPARFGCARRQAHSSGATTKRQSRPGENVVGSLSRLTAADTARARGAAEGPYQRATTCSRRWGSDAASGSRSGTQAPDFVLSADERARRCELPG